MNYTIIKNKAQYKEYCTKLMNFGSKKYSKEIGEKMELLELLIDKWEKDNLKNEDMDPIQLLKYLMESKNIGREQLIDILDISKGAVSRILNYKKGLSKKSIRILSEYFKVSQEAFNRHYEIKSEYNTGYDKMMNVPKKLALAA